MCPVSGELYGSVSESGSGKLSGAQAPFIENAGIFDEFGSQASPFSHKVEKGGGFYGLSNDSLLLAGTGLWLAALASERRAAHARVPRRRHGADRRRHSERRSAGAGGHAARPDLAARQRDEPDGDSGSGQRSHAGSLRAGAKARAAAQLHQDM